MTTQIQHATTKPRPEFLEATPPPSFHDRVPFDTLLRQANEPIFHPGGPAAAKQLQDWTGLDIGGRVLEVASEVGRTGGMHMAHRFGAHVMLVASDPSNLAMAHHFAKKEGLADEQWETKVTRNLAEVADSLKDEDQIDCAIVEQSTLSHCWLQSKRTMLEGLAQHSAQVLLHEFCLRGHACRNPSLAYQVESDLSHALARPIHLLDEEHWRQLLDLEGMEISQLETGAVHIWHPKWLLLGTDGIAHAVHEAWSAVTHKELGSRLWELHETLAKHKDNVGYILIQAKRATEQSIYLHEQSDEGELWPSTRTTLATS